MRQPPSDCCSTPLSKSRELGVVACASHKTLGGHREVKQVGHFGAGPHVPLPLPVTTEGLALYTCPFFPLKLLFPPHWGSWQKVCTAQVLTMTHLV